MTTTSRTITRSAASIVLVLLALLGAAPARAETPEAPGCAPAFRSWSPWLGWVPTRDLDTILAECPRLRSRMVWQTGLMADFDWNDWTPARRDRLQQLYERLLDGWKDLGVECPDPGASTRLPATANVDTVFLTRDQAFDVYAANVAHALYLQATGAVPWSLVDAHIGEIDAIFRSDNYATPIRPSSNTYYPAFITVGDDFQLTARAKNSPHLLCDPRHGHRFVTGLTSTSYTSMVGATPLDTLRNLSVWMSHNVLHGGVPDDYLRANWAWSTHERLRHAPPARAADGIVAPSGCHSAAHLLADLARSVNIGLLLVGTQDTESTSGHYLNRSHAGLVYAASSDDELILWHADDLYAFADRPHFPIDEAGWPVTGAAAEKRFFEAVWRSRWDLHAWGFTPEPGLPTIAPGVSVGINDRGAYEDMYDFGHYAGAWRLASNNAPTDPFSHLAIVDHYERGYQLCSAELVELYCTPWGEPYFTASLSSMTYASTELPELPEQRSLADYHARIGACVAAHGGCPAVLGAIAAWESSYGSAVASY